MYFQINNRCIIENDEKWATKLCSKNNIVKYVINIYIRHAYLFLVDILKNRNYFIDGDNL